MQVMPNFIPYDYRQDTMVVINFEDQILAGTFEHAVHFLIEYKVDLSAFHAFYRNELSYSHIPEALRRAVRFNGVVGATLFSKRSLATRTPISQPLQRLFVIIPMP
jgi:hypothetical protein